MDVPERPKRQKRDPFGKMKAFEKLKLVKSGGGKNKYEVDAIDNVYEEVTEEEYTEAVLKRQHDDWIVGDYGAEGYVEDGREIFDDDLDEESIQKGRKSKKRDHSGIPKNIEAPKGNIQKMLANMPAKKRKTVNLENDELLGDLMGELDTAFGSKSKTDTSSTRNTPNDSYGMRSSRNTTNDTFAPKNLKITPTSSNYKEIVNKCPRNIIKECNTPTSLPASDEVSKISEPQIEAKPTYGISVANDSKASEDLCSELDMAISAEWDTDFPVPDASDEISNQMEKSKIEANQAPKNIPKEEPGMTEEQLCTGWQTLSSSSNDTVPSINIDCSKLPLVEKDDGTKVFKFFYWDAYEDIFNKPGTIFLFGKVCVEGSTYASCCVTVKNVERRLFLLPRVKKYDMLRKQSIDEVVKIIDVYHEFNNKFSNKYNITTFKTRKVNKNYAFNLADVPDTSEYLEIRYGAEFSALPANLTGETFSRVFGTNTSFLEIFLIERRIKGPGWLEIIDPTVSNPLASWCKFEVTCDDMNNISVVNEKIPPPPLVLMAINFRITPIPKQHDNQVTMISCLVHNNYHTDREAPARAFEHHFCAFTKPDDVSWPYDSKEALENFKSTKLDKVHNERGLLGLFLAKFHKIDPDLIVGHDIYGFDIGTLVHRLMHLKIMHWSRLGRLRRANAPNFGKSRNFAERNIMCGRLLCDITISAKELIKARSYDLDTLCQQVLNNPEGSRKSLSSEEIKNMYKSSKSLIQLIELTMLDTSYILRIMYKLNVIPLSLQITNIAGNVLSRTLMGGRAERNEYLLLHAFHDKNYIVPDKSYGKRNKDPTETVDVEEANVGKGKRKPQYEGGLVLEPKKGFYDKLILLMDFNSLYPSIIQEFNICFTTVSVRGMDFDEGDLMTLMNHLPSVTQPGILPTEIRKLVESRKAVKSLMAMSDISSDLKHQYDIRQLALKLTANSMYGCLGFPNSRFYAKPLAAMVTAKGREILVNTRDLVQRLNFEVIYGDTDSLMINSNSTDYDEVLKIGRQIKQEINKSYKKIEIDIDGIFKFILLLKKKKYASVTLSKVNGQLVTKQEIKGLDIVRRDWSQLSANAGRYVLNQLLCDANLEDKLANIHAKLAEIKKALEEDQVSISELAITKQLTKNPEDYADKKSLPHVQVAVRLNQTLTKKFKQGDTVFYVVCEDGTTNAATQRAYHLDELKNNANLKIDVKYYLSQQVHPVVTRLCEPIEGIDAVQIAESLGLDTSAYIRRIDTIIEENEEMAVDEADKFKNCEKFEFHCLNEKCKRLNTLQSPIVKEDNGAVYASLERCANPDCVEAPFSNLHYLQNKLTITIRSFIHKYYLNWMVCEEPTCAYRTRVISRLNKNLDPLCSRCSNKNILVREYNESQLYNQLCFFQYLFNIATITGKHKLNISHDSPLYNTYIRLKEDTDEILKSNAYNIIDLGKICQQMLMKN